MATFDEHPLEPDEDARLAALDRYKILDTAPEEEFEDIVQLAAQICGVPISLISLVDEERQWFKAKIGLDAPETSREVAFCTHTMQQSDVLVVNDASIDARFSDNPLVRSDPHLRFYAGAPLTTPDGFVLGTLCVLDRKPRELTVVQQQALERLARQVIVQLELRRALIQQREDQKRNRLIIESAVDYAIITTGLDGSVTGWSPGAAAIMGWTEQEMCGRHIAEIFTIADREDGIPEHEMRAARVSGRGADERWHLRSDGSRFWASGELMPLTDESDVPVGYVKILRDRTEQRTSAEQVGASEKRWRELFQNMSEGFFVAELVRNDEGKAVDYRFLEINEAFSKQSGIPGSSVGKTIRDFAKDIDQWLIDRFATTVKFGEPQQFEIQVPDLNRWFEVRSAKDEGERFSCLFLDISARKSTEAELARQDERLQMALTASGAVGLWDWMVDTDLLHGDATFARLYGLSVAETAAGVTMEQYQKFVVAEDIAPLRERIRAVFERGEDFLVEYRIAIPGEALRWVECRGRMVVDEDGCPHRFSGTAVDVTARKTAEEQRQLLLDEQAHRMKNTFAMVQSLTAQTLKGVDETASQTLQSRLAALSQAHDILLQTGWQSMSISSVMAQVLRFDIGVGRFAIDGADFELNADAALSLSLLIHELTTNAVKHGALSNDAGRVLISWEISEELFQLRWDEKDGPPAIAPSRKGFGSRLLAMGIRGSRRTRLSYDEEGLHATFEAEVAAVRSSVSVAT